MTDQRPREVVEAMSYVISRHPFFAVLLFTLHNLKVTDTVKTAATDSKTIYVNPTWFNALPIEERAFVICHELLHTALNHILRAKGYVEMGFGPDMKPFSARKWNEAADYVVNPLLIAMGLTKMPVGGLLNPQFTADSLVDEVYTQLPDPDPNQDQDPGDGHGGFDQHMPAAGDAPSAAEVATAVVQAANAQKAQGDLPAGLARLVQELVSPTKNWRELLADALRVSVGRDEASWARPNRRRLA
nr:hypothetical protein [Candidatus Nanopelagicales bacterium]